MLPKASDVGNPAGSGEVKIVWDVTIGDESLFEDRMGLVQQADEVIRKKGMVPKFVLIIHGAATKFVTRTLAGTRFENEKVQRMSEIHKVITAMNNNSMRFVLCEVPMTRNNVSRDNILPFVDTSETVFFDLAVLQMEGYAYIPLNG